MKTIRIIPQLLLGLLVASCIACSNMAPKSFNDYAGDVLQGTDAVVQTTRTLLAAKKITSSDAENVLKMAETARDGVAVARQTAVTQGQAAGNDRLRVSADALNQLSIYLAGKGK